MKKLFIFFLFILFFFLNCTDKREIGKYTIIEEITKQENNKTMKHKIIYVNLDKFETNETQGDYLDSIIKYAKTSRGPSQGILMLYFFKDKRNIPLLEDMLKKNYSWEELVDNLEVVYQKINNEHVIWYKNYGIKDKEKVILEDERYLNIIKLDN